MSAFGAGDPRSNRGRAIGFPVILETGASRWQRDHARYGTTMEDSELEEREAEYQSRNESIRHTIDVLAQYDAAELDEHGKKSEIAREHDIETHRIYYVLNHWKDLVGYRRHANTDPLDPDAVKAAYDDETMQALAGQQPVADGAGNINIQITLTLDEVFRAIKLLPGDLGLKVYGQTLESDFDRGVVRRMLEGDE